MATATSSPSGAMAARLGGLAVDAAQVADRLRDAVVVVSAGQAGSGSGTVWNPEGLIVTNHHVAPEDTAEITLRDGRSFQGTIVARDEENDLAAFRIPATGLPSIEIRDSDTVRVGEVVLAVGNPWGQRGAVSSGIVFSKNGASVDGLPTLGKAIRADITLAPGNSGGPLADSEGRVIGINAMIAGGMAIAITSNAVGELLPSGVTAPGIIGITGQPVPVAASLQSADGAGLIVTSVEDGSPAEAAGLIPGDVILSVGQRPRSLVNVAAGLKRMRAGVPVSLSIARAGAPRNLEATPAVQS